MRRRSSVPSSTSRSRPRPPRAEAADRERRPVDRQRRDHHVDPRAVGEPGVDHRAELVDPPAERRQDALDRVAQLLLVGEADVGRLDPPARARRRRAPGPLTITSSTPGSASSSSSGPRPTVSRRIRAGELPRGPRSPRSAASLVDQPSHGLARAPPPAACRRAASARRRSISRPRSACGEPVEVALARVMQLKRRAELSPALGCVGWPGSRSSEADITHARRRCDRQRRQHPAQARRRGRRRDLARRRARDPAGERRGRRRSARGGGGDDGRRAAVASG